MHRHINKCTRADSLRIQTTTFQYLLNQTFFQSHSRLIQVPQKWTLEENWSSFLQARCPSSHSTKSQRTEGKLKVVMSTNENHPIKLNIYWPTDFWRNIRCNLHHQFYDASIHRYKLCTAISDFSVTTITNRKNDANSRCTWCTTYSDTNLMIKIWSHLNRNLT